ncbi:hypothetical protein OCHUTO_0798 [Orientia chuto str. Dubai]|uniref:Uncharacterized protein n=1 Tax=Orientia chuto str. Dubai TaxID=1359168 RepID=A0A0F3MJF8_9RICK|nr:hypothetical protein OCHUTO_0798 [Orientia chuto str. Dubai]
MRDLIGSIGSILICSTLRMVEHANYTTICKSLSSL